VSTVDELAELRWVFEPFGSDAYFWAQRVCREAGFEPVVSFDSSDLRVHHGLVTAGLAAAFLPDMLFRSPTLPVSEPRHRYDWPQRPGDDLYRDIYVVTRRGGHTRTAVAGLLQHIREVAAASTWTGPTATTLPQRDSTLGRVSDAPSKIDQHEPQEHS
jgi:DNA-binding transcriptional LysR family regulator